MAIQHSTNSATEKDGYGASVIQSNDRSCWIAIDVLSIDDEHLLLRTVQPVAPLARLSLLPLYELIIDTDWSAMDV